MEIHLKDEVRELRVISVVLDRDHDDPYGYRLKMWFCPNCQNPVIQYKGEMSYVLPGDLGIAPSTYIKCSNSRCRKIYSFQSIV